MTIRGLSLKWQEVSSSLSSKRAQGIHNPALLDPCTSSNCSRPYQKGETTCESTEVQIYKSYKHLQLGVLFNIKKLMMRVSTVLVQLN